MRKEKRLYIFRGVAGSGKSFLARNIAGKTGGKIYSSDELLLAQDAYIWSPVLVYIAHQTCEQLVKLAMQRSERTIIVDNTNIKPRHARPYVNMAIKYGYKIIVREPDTTWKFDLKSLMEHGTHALPEEVIKHMLENWLNMPLNKFKEVLEINDTGTNCPQPTSSQEKEETPSENANAAMPVLQNSTCLTENCHTLLPCD